jgi:hypothetical protein
VLSVFAFPQQPDTEARTMTPDYTTPQLSPLSPALPNRSVEAMLQDVALALKLAAKAKNELLQARRPAAVKPSRKISLARRLLVTA